LKWLKQYQKSTIISNRNNRKITAVTKDIYAIEVYALSKDAVAYITMLEASSKDDNGELNTINLINMIDNKRTLEEQKEEFKRKKLLASPIAGLIAWLAVAISGTLFSDQTTVWVLFIATGSIVYLAMGISKLTGEDYLDK